MKSLPTHRKNTIYSDSRLMPRAGKGICYVLLEQVNHNNPANHFASTPPKHTFVVNGDAHDFLTRPMSTLALNEQPKPLRHSSGHRLRKETRAQTAVAMSSECHRKVIGMSSECCREVRGNIPKYI